MELVILSVWAGIGIGIAAALMFINLKTKFDSRKKAPSRQGPRPSQTARGTMAATSVGAKLSWMSSFGVKPNDLAKVQKMVVATDKPIFITELNPGLSKSLKTLQAEGKITGIEASRFVSGEMPLAPEHVLVYATHVNQTYADRAFIIRVSQSNPF